MVKRIRVLSLPAVLCIVVVVIVVVGVYFRPTTRHHSAHVTFSFRTAIQDRNIHPTSIFFRQRHRLLQFFRQQGILVWGDWTSSIRGRVTASSKQSPSRSPVTRRIGYWSRVQMVLGWGWQRQLREEVTVPSSRESNSGCLRTFRKGAGSRNSSRYIFSTIALLLSWS